MSVDAVRGNAARRRAVRGGRAAAAALVAVTAAAPAFAHHSVLGFETARGITLRGVVAEVIWNNPHTQIAVDVSQGPERGTRWVIESESPIVLRRLGWKDQAVRRGDMITVTGAPAKGGRRVVRCQSVTPPGGSPLPCYPSKVQ